MSTIKRGGSRVVGGRQEEVRIGAGGAGGQGREEEEVGEVQQ